MTKIKIKKSDKAQMNYKNNVLFRGIITTISRNFFKPD